MDEELFRDPATYEQRPIMRSIVARTLRGLFFSGLFSRTVEIEGLEIIGSIQKPAIIAPNHRSMAETLLNGVMMENVRDREVYFGGKDDLWKNRALGWFIEGLGAFPVNRRGGGSKHFEDTCKYLLQQRQAHVVVYPTGTRDRGHTIMPPKKGAANLSVATGAPLIPVGQAGTEHILDLKNRSPVSIQIGLPLYPKEGLAVTKNERGVSEASEELSARWHNEAQVLYDVARKRIQEML